MHDNHQDRVIQLNQTLGLFYVGVSKTLLALPTPIKISKLEPGEHSVNDIQVELIRARTLLVTMTDLHHEAAMMMDNMILDYLTAAILVAIDDHDPQEWHLDSAEFAIGRVAIGARLLADHHGIIGRPWEGDPNLN